MRDRRLADARREPKISELSQSAGTTRLSHHVLNVAALHSGQTVMPASETRAAAHASLRQSDGRSL